MILSACFSCRAVWIDILGEISIGGVVFMLFFFFAVLRTQALSLAFLLKRNMVDTKVLQLLISW